MAQFRGRSRLLLPRTARRLTSWEIGPTSGTNGASLALSASTAQIGALGSETIVAAATLVRTRGDFLLFLKSSNAAGGGFHGAFGIGLIGKPAFTAGVASVPTPLTEVDWDGWLFHRFFSCISTGVIDGSVSSDQDQGNALAAVVRFEIDSKAMRKSGTDMVFYSAIEVTEAGVSTAEWLFNSRMLFKLS